MKEVYYREFRPNQFTKVVGQDPAMTILKSGFQNDSLHHAYLFAGHSGSGKTTSARILAAVVNCEHRANGSSEACWKCDSCTSVKEGASTDFREIDGGSQGGKEEIKKIIECSMFRPSRMKKRVFVIDEAHELSSAAWSSLLKPTEEPDSHVMFIFCTSEYAKVPNTVASRCRRVNFRPVKQNVIADYLVSLSNHMRVNLGREIPTCTKGACMQIAAVSDGNLRDALNYLESMFIVKGVDKKIDIDEAREFLGLVGRDLLYDIVDAVVERKTGKALDLMVSVGETAPDFRQLCNELGKVFRNVMHLSCGLSSVVKVIDEEHKILTKIVSNVSVERACLFCGMFADAIRAFEVNSDKRWVLESLVARLSTE